MRKPVGLLVQLRVSYGIVFEDETFCMRLCSSLLLKELVYANVCPERNSCVVPALWNLQVEP